MKDKAFAAGVHREAVHLGIELIGLPRAEHIRNVIDGLADGCGRAGGAGGGPGCAAGAEGRGGVGAAANPVAPGASSASSDRRPCYRAILTRTPNCARHCDVGTSGA